MSSVAFAGHGDYSGGSGGGSSDGIGATQQRRASERFNIIDYIRGQQATIGAQNSKYGRGGGKSGPYLDFVLSYLQDTGPVTRNSVALGKDTRSMGRVQFLLDDLFTAGNRKQLLNIDLGFEGFLSQTTSFVVDPAATQTSHAYTETGGGLLLRPFGRSSQDTGLLVKGGYLNVSETGLWFNTQTPVSVYAPYLGGEVKLYLLPIFGVRGEYQYAVETQIDALQGKWKMQRFTYGAFLEFYLLNLGAYFMNTEMDLTPTSTGVVNKENYTGVGFSGTLYF